MSSRERLDQYLHQARGRLQRVLLSQAAALLGAALLGVTALASLWLGRAAYSGVAVGIGRALLAATLLGAAAWALLRWRALQRNQGAEALERALPAQGGRLHTYLQESRRDGEAPFLLELLADDAVRIAEAEPLQRSIPTRQLAVPAAVAGVAFAALLAMLLAGSGLGDGARHLWLGRLPPASRIAMAAGGIAVKPGDVSVRRNQDLAISALVAGGPRDAQLHVKFADGDWETAPMVAGNDGGFAFTLYAVRDGARYYVSAGSLKSREHRIEVVDLPRIEGLRLTYRYPAWTGLAQQVQEDIGDIRAVAGTQVSLEVRTDKPLQSPLVIVNGDGAPLSQRQLTSTGSLTVKQPGHYRIAARFGNEVVPLTDDYVIDVVPDEKPTVQILKPGRDYRASPIEEVPVGIRAMDDFRLEALELHYAVNGGDWRIEKLPAGSADIQAAALLRLEEMQQKGPHGEAPLLVPGDLVSYYALARDHSASAQTDLFLIQVQPFDQRFTQSQANGGGGGGGGDDDQGEISQRQREVLLATFNLQRNRTRDGGRAAEREADSARMLSEVQNTLAEQARTLVERAKARELTEDQNVNQFVKSLEEATRSMVPAAESLDRQDLEAAVKHEQQALQHLLRAEATFREIQVSMQRGGGGGGGGGQAGRDVSEMTELEMDLAKNQYETQSSMSQQQRSQAEDEALRRLRELARRQEQLAREAARQQAQPEAQKWQQEQLRREAEQLRQQLQQLAQQQQRGGQQGGQQGSQQGGQQGQSSGAAAEAARQLDEALRQMQARNGSPRENAARAGEQLRRAGEQMERGQRQAVGDRFGELARAARELGEKQRQSEQDLRAALTQQAPASIARPGAQSRGGLGFEQAQRLAQQKREIQAGLEELQRQMRGTRQQGATRAPRATERVAQATKDLEASDTALRIARSASEIERGRGVQAASRDGLINEGLEQLQQGLEEAASVAAGENGAGGERRPAQREAGAGDLLAELSELRRAVAAARAGAPGESGRSGGTQGEGELGQGSGGPDAGGGRGRFAGSGQIGPVRALSDTERRALREQGQLSSQRLQQLREQLAQGALAEADLGALRELSERLRRGGADPLSAEYPRMALLLDQLELAALKAGRVTKTESPAAANGTVDDSRRYRDNVAEYYRKLGETNDR